MKDKIRVCFIIDSFGRAGTELQLLLLLKYLDRNRIEPYLVFSKEMSETARAVVPADVPILFLGIKRLCSVFTLKKEWEFRRFLKRERIDLIQAYFLDSTCFASIAGKLSGVKVFGARRDIGHWLTPRKVMVGKFLNRFFIDKILANADACKRAVVEQEGARPENVIVIPNGIEYERFASIPTWKPKNGNTPRRIGSVGNLKPVKGTDIFIDAAKIVLEKHPDVLFELAGNETISDYREQIATLGIGENIRLAGSCDNVPKFLAAIDIAVLPSRAEGLSNGLLEYMAAGRPCIATDVGGNGELIEHERNGLLVPTENPQALADAICKLLSNQQQAETLATNARNDVQTKYNPINIANRFCEVCEQVINP
ncbi:MAG: glycosyltransferase family 4 protein [Planctomycetaceae bacterium]|jgi:glycosyltransferase involved in cell wall biosynthesis|nr:glycosyltransferase family 4 protein [Planctomycetaceae bacterium]